MTPMEAKMMAVKLFGETGCARTVRYQTGGGRWAFDYRVGTLERGRYYDFGRGVNYRKAFDQARATIAEDILQESIAERVRNADNKLLQELIEESHRPIPDRVEPWVYRRHAQAQAVRS